MEFQIMKSSKGRSLYFGHPYSKETYTNSVQLKTPVECWEGNIDDIYTGAVIDIVPVDYVNTNALASEHRVIRGTKVMFIGDYQKVQEMLERKDFYYQCVENAKVKWNNPDYMSFEKYTKQILKKPLKSVEEIDTLNAEQAKQYMEAAVAYDRDKKYSDKLVLQPFFKTFEDGVLILSEDFVDYNLDLDIDPKLGVVGIHIQQAECTSHYLYLYKEI